jgi:hypothetical protein
VAKANNGYYLGKLDYINTTLDRQSKKFCQENINAGHQHHHQHPYNPYPFQPTT